MDNQEQFIKERINEFFEYFYKRQLYDYKGQQTYANLGQIDTYELKHLPSNLIQQEKKKQLDHSYHGEHHHASHLVLESYNQQNTDNLPKWLPQYVGVKTIKNISEQEMNNLKNQIDDNLVNYWKNCPDIAKVYAYQITQNEFKSYIQLNNTLNNEIEKRQQERQPFTEQLLWKMLYSLIKASHNLKMEGQNLVDVRHNRVFYDKYQASVLPYGTGHKNDQSIRNRLITGDSFFHHRDFINEIDNQENDIDMCVFYNESYQIGITVLAAGLLKTEQQMDFAFGNKFNQQKLDQCLWDFGNIYGNNNRNLQFTLQELMINQGRQNPSQIFEILDKISNHILFLEHNIHEHLNHLYENQQPFIQKRVQFMNRNKYENSPSYEFKQQYPYHYYIELKMIEYNNIKLNAIKNGHTYKTNDLQLEERVEQVKHASKVNRQHEIIDSNLPVLKAIDSHQYPYSSGVQHHFIDNNTITNNNVQQSISGSGYKRYEDTIHDSGYKQISQVQYQQQPQFKVSQQHQYAHQESHDVHHNYY